MSLVYFDYCAIILLAMCIFSVVFQKLTVSVSGRILFLVLAVSLIAACCDAAAILTEGTTHIVILYLTNYLYFFFRNLAPVLYLLFLISLTDTWHVLLQKPRFCALLCAPFIVLVLALATNPFTHKIFYIDQARHYVRGSFFLLLYLISFFYLIYGMYYITKYRKLFSGFKLFSLYAVFLFTILSVVWQFFFPAWVVESYATAITFLTILITVKRPEETVDAEVGLMKSSAYVADLRNHFSNHKKFTVIHILTDNYSSIVKLLGYERTYQLFRRAGDRLNEINKAVSSHSDLYYLDSGFFCYLVSESFRGKVDEIAARIHNALKQSIVLDEIEINLNTHICIINCPEDFSDSKTLMSFLLSYRKILPQFGPIANVSDILKDPHHRFIGEMDRIISRALAERKFEIYYQPIYSVSEKRFRFAEALLRLKDETYGFIPPDLIIATAENNGSIHDIGAFVFEEVCRFVSSPDFTPLNLDFVSINISILQAMQPDLAQRYMEILDRHHCPPQKINLEITETAVTDQQNIVKENMIRLSESGITFSLDDYGTGYSNIKRVSYLPLQIVKLDKVIADEVENPRMGVIVKHTIDMIRELNMEIVVEGVETKDLADKFADMNCDYIQGYYYSRPLPRAELIKLLEAQAQKE